MARRYNYTTPGNKNIYLPVKKGCSIVLRHEKTCSRDPRWYAQKIWDEKYEGKNLISGKLFYSFEEAKAWLDNICDQ